LLGFIGDSDISCCMQEKVANGETSFIDPRYYSRSFGENSLVDIILACWVFNPDERIGINELQEMLEEAVALDEHFAKSNYTGWHHDQPTGRDSNNGYSEVEGNQNDSDSEETFEEEDHYDESDSDNESIPWRKTIAKKTFRSTQMWEPRGIIN
jgi:hypothetical protein